MIDDEIQQLREALQGVLALPKDDTPPLVDPDWRTSWQGLTDLDLVGFCVPEDRDGLGFRVDAAAATAIELGAALHGSPFAGITASAAVLGSSAEPEAAELLARLQTGEAVCAFAQLAPSSDLAHLVDSAAEADALVVRRADGSLFLAVEPWQTTASAPTFDATRSIGSVRVDLATCIPLNSDLDPLPLYHLLLAADALGGVRRSLERAVAYTGTRGAFGKVLGGFQAVQHRLVDHTITARGLDLLVREAAQLLTDGDPAGGKHVALARLAVGQNAVRILHDLVQLSGAIAFTWEHGLHLFERRAHLDVRLAGGIRGASRALTALEDVAPAAADSSDYREAVRAFIAAGAPALRAEGVRVPIDDAEEQQFRTWLASLYAAGHLGAGWPVEWGGRADHQAIEDLVLMEELIRARAYRPLDQVMLASHAILSFGSPAQKDELLPKIRRGEHVWCQLFSEPDAGSDLASLRTRAERDGDHFVVTGQKVWSTDAQWADMGILLARTDPTVDRHAGLTAFVVPMDLPGLDIRPIKEMTGSAEFCEVFLEGLRLGPEHVLGEVDQGWKVITSGLASERAFVGANSVLLEMQYNDLVALAEAARLLDGSRAIDHADVQDDLAIALAEVEAAKLIVRDTVERILVDQEHPSDGPVAKLAYTELNVSLCERALDLIANAEWIDDDGLEVVQRWYEGFLWSRALTISGGASEILRGLVGRQLLGLPRA